MSVQINEEAMLIIMSIYGGLILILCYDAIRIFRRVFSVGWVRIIVEDIIFWTVAAIFMFNIYLKYNYGRPRFFSILFTVLTMLVFEWLIGRKFIDKVAGLLRKTVIKLLKPLKKYIKASKLNKEIRKKERENARSKEKKSKKKNINKKA